MHSGCVSSRARECSRFTHSASNQLRCSLARSAYPCALFLCETPPTRNHAHHGPKQSSANTSPSSSSCGPKDDLTARVAVNALTLNSLHTIALRPSEPEYLSPSSRRRQKTPNRPPRWAAAPPPSRATPTRASTPTRRPRARPLPRTAPSPTPVPRRATHRSRRCSRRTTSRRTSTIKTS